MIIHTHRNGDSNKCSRTPYGRHTLTQHLFQSLPLVLNHPPTDTLSLPSSIPCTMEMPTPQTKIKGVMKMTQQVPVSLSYQYKNVSHWFWKPWKMLHQHPACWYVQVNVHWIRWYTLWTTIPQQTPFCNIFFFCIKYFNYIVIIITSNDEIKNFKTVSGWGLTPLQSLALFT